MSPRRGRILVALVWIISFLICCPPLLGWNERGKLGCVGWDQIVFWGIMGEGWGRFNGIRSSGQVGSGLVVFVPVRILVALAWGISFLICIPPLLGCNER